MLKQSVAGIIVSVGRSVLRLLTPSIIIAGLIVLVLILSLKNPYNTQSLVPNLEPYPDTLFYAYPALNLLQNGDFSMSQFAASPKIVTPPGYTWFLLPYFALFGNVLGFFWAHIVLIVITTWLLALTLRKILSEHWLLLALPGFIFVTNFYVFTMPSLMMAELISMCVFTIMLYLLVQDVTHKRITTAALMVVFMSFIKFSNVPFSVVFIGAYALKIWSGSCYNVSKRAHLRHFVGLIVVVASLAGVYFYVTDIFADHKNLQPGSTLAPKYFADNIIFYVKTLFGQGTRYLWYQEKLLPNIVSMAALLGLLFGIARSKTRLMAGAIVVWIGAQLTFMATFVTPDARYFAALLPGLVVGFGLFLREIMVRFGDRTLLVTSALFVGLYLFVPQTSVDNTAYVLTLKKQIGLNYLHPENPWNYAATQEFNEYVAKAHEPGDTVYIGTFLPPHYVEFFADGYTPVPVTFKQEFFSPMDPLTIPGESKAFMSMLNYYDALLSQGDVYVSNAYESNRSDIWPAALGVLLESYEHEVVAEGCMGTCSLYKLVERKSVLADVD